MVVIRTLRNWVHIAPARSTGWLGALADVRISRALKAVHDQPFRRWTVSGLAQVAGMSRSSFAERFTALVGDPPLQYQTHWRLTLAKDLLESGNLLVSDVARRIGYDSDAAFSRAFKNSVRLLAHRSKKIIEGNLGRIFWKEFFEREFRVEMTAIDAAAGE